MIGGVTSPGAAALVLVGVLLVGVAAGRAKRRWTLLVAGVVALVVLAGVLTGVVGAPEDDRAAGITALYRIAVPLVVAFGAGWLCGRGTWFGRALVLGAAVLLLAAFPYDAAGRATADALLGSAVPPSDAPGQRSDVLTALDAPVVPAAPGAAPTSPGPAVQEPAAPARRRG